MTSFFTGLRVLELADHTAAYAGRMLAGLGADVMKIEPPSGDTSRAWPPFVDSVPDANGGLYFIYMNAGKRSVTLDLSKPEGVSLFKQLAKTADVLIETTPPGHLDSLGLGYASLKRQNPRLVMASVTGYGQTGPHRDYKATDITTFAMSGLMNSEGDADTPPMLNAGWQTYLIAGITAADAVGMALFHRHSTGKGRHIDISMQEAMAALATGQTVTTLLYDRLLWSRRAVSIGSIPSGNFPCKDGFVSLQIARPHHWKAMAQWIAEVAGIQEALDPKWEGPTSNRRPHKEQIDGWVKALTGKYTKREFLAEGQRRKLPVGGVSTPADLADDIQLNARGYFQDVPAPAGRTLRQPAFPFKVEGPAGPELRPAPRLGQHNVEVFQRDLGLTAQEMATLRANRVI